jgi:5'-methylthioadenosine phosphorylase
LTIGILGASRFGLAALQDRAVDVVTTPFGDLPYERGAIGGVPAVWIRRFGWGNNRPSHEVNHRAHIAALSLLGVRRAFTLNGFGGVNVEFKVGDLAVPHDYIKFVHREPPSILTGAGWRRVDLGAAVGGPYCPEVREALVGAASQTSSRTLWPRAVNICVQGPHLETEAEIEAARRLGADLISTTIYPELVYARELGICFASICWISNLAGRESTGGWNTPTDDELVAILGRAAQLIAVEAQSCQCQQAQNAQLTPTPPPVPV